MAGRREARRIVAGPGAGIRWAPRTGTRLGGSISVALVVLAGTALGSAGAGPAAGLLQGKGVAGWTHPAGTNSHYCDGCTPPLVYSGGPVLSADSSTGLTITPIYWAPASFSFATHYQQIVNGFITNLAAASGQETNFSSVDTEYYQVVSGASMYANDTFIAGTPAVDTAPYPSSGFKPVNGATVCLTDQQLRAELVHLTTSLGLPTDLTHLYPLFLPDGVEIADRDGSNSASDFCGYHRGFAGAHGEIVYAVLPFETSGCDAGEAPNGDLVADATVSTLAHEISEAVTDPEDQITSWNDSSGNEIADICGNSYGSPLGSTNAAHAETTEYNQVINGGKYYIQEMFSNLAYGTLGSGHGCVQSEALAQHPKSASGPVVVSIYSEATPTRLPADGRSTSSLDISVGDSNGDNVVGDLVTLQTRTRNGAGRCGHLSRKTGHTGSGGDIVVTYTASTANIECEISAVEAKGGLSANTVIFQGTKQRVAPTITANFPSSVRAGGPPVVFTIAVRNPSGDPVPATQIDLALYQGGSAAGVVRAGQVHVEYSTAATGPFAPVSLSGTTAADDSIEGSVGPPEGTALVGGSTQMYTFRLSVDSGVPVERRGQPLLSIEAYLDQVDSASGTGTTLDDSYSSDLHVIRHG